MREWNSVEKRLALRGFFILLFAIICFVQCYSIIKSFLKYPRIIDMYDHSPSLITIMPGLTICSNNRRAMEEKFAGQLDTNGGVKSLVDRQTFNNFRDELARMFEKLNLNPQDITANATLNELFNIRPDTHPFIKWFGCARTWKNSINCENLTQIDSITSRMCATLLHSGTMLYDAINRPELFNASGMSSHSLSYFDSKEVVKIILNFEPEDYADLKRQIGARITFHSNNYVAAQGSLDFFVTRGYRYDFSIDRKDVRLIGLPYDKCHDYHRENIDKYRTRIEPHTPLASNTCVQNCIIKNVMKKSNCWPPTLPYFRNDSLDPELNIKTCPWFAGSYNSIYYELVRLDNYRQRLANNKTTGSIQEQTTADNKAELGAGSFPLPEAKMIKSRTIDGNHRRSYREINRFCMSKCILSCRIVTYTVSVTRSAWPSDVKILFDPTGKVRARRHCCALISIKFTHFHYSVHEYKPKYEVIDTIGDLGGLLAFWLGISIVLIYRAFQKLVEICSNRSTNKIQDSRLAL